MTHRNNIFSDLHNGMTHSFEFSISESMVKDFAELTGDFNSLHINKDFGRRTMFRQNTVHGMLPFSFICLLDFFRVDSYSFSFQKFSANFLKPIFVDQKMQITGTIIDFNKEKKLINCNFVISDKKAETILTSGMLSGQYYENNRPENCHQEIHNQISRGMLLSSLSEKDLTLEQISKHDNTKFKFAVTEKNKCKLFSIFSEGTGNAKRLDHEPGQFVNINNLLANLLFSTFVGMCQPGKYATFTNFSSTFSQDIESDKVYELKGEVVFTSESTETLLENISIYDANNMNILSARGEINVKVNRPPIKMPTLSELKIDAVDWGLNDKVVLITGASRGLGETMAKLFSLYGSKVVVNYYQGKDDAERIVNEIKENGGDGFAIQSDVSQLDQVKYMVDKTFKVYKKIDVLINNAVRNTTPIDFLNLTWDEIQQDIDVALKGAFNCCKEVVPVMIKNGGGKIINMSTVFVDVPTPNQAKYIIAKSGLVGLTRSLAVEFATKNIQVNMVEPSIVQTDLAAHVSNIFMKVMANESPFKRNASVVDVAKTVIFLASSYSSYTTGQKIMVTGGRPPFL